MSDVNAESGTLVDTAAGAAGVEGGSVTVESPCPNEDGELGAVSCPCWLVDCELDVLLSCDVVAS